MYPRKMDPPEKHKGRRPEPELKERAPETPSSSKGRGGKSPKNPYPPSPPPKDSGLEVLEFPVRPPPASAPRKGRRSTTSGPNERLASSGPSDISDEFQKLRIVKPTKVLDQEPDEAIAIGGFKRERVEQWRRDAATSQQVKKGQGPNYAVCSKPIL
jgi:hypothetical protein